MTPEQLKKLETELEKRGYKRWSMWLVGSEDYAWFKSFDVNLTEDGDRECDYQIAFRVWDWRKYDTPNTHPESEIGLTITMILPNHGGRFDCDYSLQGAVPNVDMCEAMMKELSETAKKYFNNTQSQCVQ